MNIRRVQADGVTVSGDLFLKEFSDGEICRAHPGGTPRIVFRWYRPLNDWMEGPLKDAFGRAAKWSGNSRLRTPPGDFTVRHADRSDCWLSSLRNAA